MPPLLQHLRGDDFINNNNNNNNNTKIEQPRIVFFFLVHKWPNRVMQMIHSLYSPRHYYCIHVDATLDESEKDTFKILSLFSKRYDNVFISGVRFSNNWGGISLVYPLFFSLFSLFFLSYSLFFSLFLSFSVFFSLFLSFSLFGMLSFTGRNLFGNRWND